MAIQRSIPLDSEREFRLHELFFSVTDKKGIIMFANSVFTRISGFTEEELLGQPHNIIRHPDIPRAVFKLLWDYLEAGNPIAAYVKNLAKDGKYYWVMALVFPCEGGYLSVRLKPSSEFFAAAKAIYKETIKLEHKLESTLGKKAAMQQTLEHIVGLLNAHGFATYDDFMWTALASEMRSRQEKLGNSTNTKPLQSTSSASLSQHLQALDYRLNGLFAELDTFKNLNAALIEHSDFILALARSIKLLSLNAQIGSLQLGDQGRTLAVVAEKMGQQSVDGEDLLSRFQHEVSDLSSILTKLNFDIIAAKLQVEMASCFVAETLDGLRASVLAKISTGDATKLLFDAFIPRIESIVGVIAQLPARLRKLQTHVNQLERFIQILQFIHFTGKVEAARSADATSFAMTFRQLITEVEEAGERLRGLSQFIHMNSSRSATISASEKAFKDHLYVVQQEDMLKEVLLTQSQDPEKSNSKSRVLARSSDDASWEMISHNH